MKLTNNSKSKSQIFFLQSIKKLKFYKLSFKSLKKILTSILFKNKKIRKQPKKLEEEVWEWEVVIKQNNKKISKMLENLEKAKSLKRKMISLNNLNIY